MNLKKLMLTCASPFLLLTAQAALAHDAVFHGASQGVGIIDGLIHSFTGLDHLLAMVAVGILANQKDDRGQLQRNFWLLPLFFISWMTVGAAAGAKATQLGSHFSAEPLVSGSLIVLGGLVFLRQHQPLLLTASLVAGFAFCHGFVHGTIVQSATLPTSVSAQLFIAGAVAASALLHASGFILAQRLNNATLRIAGFGLLLTGVTLSV